MELSDDAAARDDERDVLVHNAHIKFIATYLNGLAVAVFAVGALAPAAPLVSTSVSPNLTLAALVLICLGASFARHSVGRSLLGRLRT